MRFITEKISGRRPRALNMIIRFFESEGMDIFLAAPTGRAAKRMTEATGFEAKTIHRLLELNSALSEDDTRKANFERNQENPLEADVVIIDEMSMVDIQLFQALLKAILPGTRLILVGDVDQLPSVLSKKPQSSTAVTISVGNIVFLRFDIDASSFRIVLATLSRWLCKQVQENAKNRLLLKSIRISGFVICLRHIQFSFSWSVHL